MKLGWSDQVKSDMGGFIFTSTQNIRSWRLSPLKSRSTKVIIHLSCFFVRAIDFGSMTSTYIFLLITCLLVITEVGEIAWLALITRDKWKLDGLKLAFEMTFLKINEISIK